MLETFTNNRTSSFDTFSHLRRLIMSNDRLRSKIDGSSEPIEELLGSLTTYNGIQRGETLGQTVRTSARVFKKMRQDSFQAQSATSNVSGSQDISDKDKKDVKHEASEKNEEENVTQSASSASNNINNRPSASTAKQRMPKALWSVREKILFFEALNEYGKDFDSITAYIHNKMKKKGVPESKTKNKHQVSHFYYRTWQKVSKYVKYGDDVKKVVQELYALINYGEIKKRLPSRDTVRVLHRLSELVWHGVVAVRAGGRTMRVRTPVCRALRRLNKLEEWEENLRLPLRVAMCLTPRDMEAWTRVHVAAHNPRVLLPVAPSSRLAPILDFLQRRWLSPSVFIRESLMASEENKEIDLCNMLDYQINSVLYPDSQNMVSWNKSLSRFCNVPIVSEEHLENKKEKACQSKTDESVQQDESVKKPTHKINVTEKDIRSSEEIDPSVKNKNDDLSNVTMESCNKNVDTKSDSKSKDESFKDQSKWQLKEECKDLSLYVGPKPGTDINIPTINVSEHLTSHRISLSAYQERSGAGLSHLQTTCQSSANIKVGGRFKTQKRLRKDSGDNETIKKQKCESDNWDKNDNFNIFDVDETANDGMDRVLMEHRNDSVPKDVMSDEKSNDEKDFNDFREKEILSEQEYEDKYNETDGECDVAIKSLKYPKVVLKLKNKKDKEQTTSQSRDTTLNNDNNEECGKPSNIFSSFFKKNWNREILLEQIQKGWSVFDSGDLTIGDLYLMFGYESKIDLNYWWDKERLPLLDDICQIKKSADNIVVSDTNTKEVDPILSQNITVEDKSKKNDQDNILQSPNNMENEVEDNKNESDIISSDPKCTSQIVNDELNTTSLNLASKIINNPFPNGNQSTASNKDSKVINSSLVVGNREQVVTIGARLQKLLSLVQLYTKKGPSSCLCGHVCVGLRGKKSSCHMNDLGVTELPGNKSVTGKNIFNKKILLGSRQDMSVNQSALNKNISEPFQFSQVLEDKGNIRKQRTQFISKLRDNVSEIKMTQNISSENCSTNTDKSDHAPQDIFQVPFTKASSTQRLQSYVSSHVVKNPGTERLQPYVSPHAVKNQIDFSTLPRWNRRTGRKPKQAVVVRNLLPLAPWPPDKMKMPPSKLHPTPTNPILIKLNQVQTSAPTTIFQKQETSKTICNELNSENKTAQEVDSIFKSSDVNPEEELNQTPFKPDVSIFGSHSEESNVNWPSKTKEIIKEEFNLLDLSLPSNIGDENSIGVTTKDDFSGLLKNESISSIPSMSPSRLLKENDEHWLNSDVNDFSLSSFLGHLEGTTPISSMKSEADSSVKTSSHIDINMSSRGTEETVDTQLQCLMSETSVDYMAKFADLAAQVSDNFK